MRHGKHLRTAPIWSQAPNDDPRSGNVLFRLQKFILTNHSTVGAVKEYNARQVEVIEAGESPVAEKETSETFEGPDIRVEDLAHPDLGENVTTVWESQESQGGELYTPCAH